jgi:hypothetical protein
MSLPAITMADNLLFFDAVGEQHFMNALRQRAPACRLGPIAAVAVEFAPNLPGMRRKQEYAVAEEDSFGDRVGDEQDGEPGFSPQLQQLVLHLAPRERVKRRKRFVHQQHVRLHRQGAGDRNALLHAAR